MIHRTNPGLGHQLRMARETNQDFKNIFIRNVRRFSAFDFTVEDMELFSFSGKCSFIQISAFVPLYIILIFF